MTEPIDLPRALALCTRVLGLSREEVHEVVAMFPGLVQEVRRTREATLERIGKVILWQNGMVMVFDRHGEQMPDLQGLRGEAIPKLRAVGWTGTPEERTWTR